LLRPQKLTLLTSTDSLVICFIAIYGASSALANTSDLNDNVNLRQHKCMHRHNIITVDPTHILLGKNRKYWWRFYW